MMTPSVLKSYTLKDLAQMAKERGVRGWHSMRKEQLVAALVREARVSGTNGDKSTQPPSASVHRSSSPQEKTAPPETRTNDKKQVVLGGSKSTPRIAKQISELKSKLADLKHLTSNPAQESSVGGSNGKTLQDRLVVMVHDPYWLHAYWELTHENTQRARAALGQHWHTAKPMLRLLEIPTGNTTMTSEVFVRDIEIHGGVNHWYIDVQDPPKSYRLDIGYQATDERYFSLARSNFVTTPAAGVTDSLDNNWKEVANNLDKIFAMSGGYSPEGASSELQEVLEQRLGRPLGSPMKTRFGMGSLLSKDNEFKLEVDSELIIYGSTVPGAHLTLQGKPVPLRSDGTFTVRYSLGDRRQVIPIVATNSDGVVQRTVIVAVERNTKVMEAVKRDPIES